MLHIFRPIKYRHWYKEEPTKTLDAMPHENTHRLSPKRHFSAYIDQYEATTVPWVHGDVSVRSSKFHVFFLVFKIVSNHWKRDVGFE